jgi:hypothetical protein
VLGERVEHAEGRQVVAGEDGRHRAGVEEEFAESVVAAVLGGRSVHQPDLAREPVPIHGGLVAVDPLGTSVASVHACEHKRPSRNAG